MVEVIGAGLAGCEAAFQIAERGIRVRLVEMKPSQFTPAHSNPHFGELVCSNSLKSDQPSTAGGALKHELRMLGSLLLAVADECAVPAGSALAVDRELFAARVHQAIHTHPLIEVVCEERSDWRRDCVTVLATGPLTSEAMSRTLTDKLGTSLHFYDAEAPIVTGESIDFSCAFTADRYGKGESDYVNCPMTQEEYTAFYEALIEAECAVLHDFDKREIFEGCMPVEVMAKRGFRTLCFGPLRPIGFRYEDGSKPFAVVQLRKENVRGDAYNIVGFQTNLTFPEQKRVFSMIPALHNVEIVRYGVMHRNTFINAPTVLDKHFSVKSESGLFIAGQLSGVEGYVESIMSGLVCGINAARAVRGEGAVSFPLTTITGALSEYLQTPNADFQPMNANFGILPPLAERKRSKEEKKAEYGNRSKEDMQRTIEAICLDVANPKAYLAERK